VRKYKKYIIYYDNSDLSAGSLSWLLLAADSGSLASPSLECLLVDFELFGF
jgi:hypothetical protein